jgi:sugar/nucleoside kinase (ribokinase family)
MGTVLNNLAALGVGRLVPVTAIGDDGHGYDLLQELRMLPVELAHIVQAADRLTPTYTKPMRQSASGEWVELNRLDLRSREPLSPGTTKVLCQHLRDVFAATDGLIVLDQINERNWGVVNDTVRGLLEELHDSDPRKLIFVDSRRHLGLFACGSLKGNRSEVLAAAGSAADSPAAVATALSQLAERTRASCYCTQGEQGILVARPGHAPHVVPGYPVTGPIDIVGAGDAASSGIVASLLCGATELEAATVGNLVASLTIQQLGTTGTASPAQVLQRGQEYLKARSTE